MPFLRLTRDRRGTENTFLMHADRPGDRPRLLYWYRTAPGITLGRPPLDEDAIRTIEEQHPDIDFDWPAILALSEVMTPEDEAQPRPQQREPRDARQGRKRSGRESGGQREAESASAHEPRREHRTPEVSAAQMSASQDSEAVESESPAETAVIRGAAVAASEPPRAEPPPPPRHSSLVDQLAGREIASRLRGRHAEMSMRIRDAHESVRESLLKRVAEIDPDRWDTPEAVLQGVSNADAIFEQLRSVLHSSRE